MSYSIQKVNEQLFAQLQSLNTEVKGEELKDEINKAKAMSDIASEIFKGAKLQLDALGLISKGHIHKEEAKLFIDNGSK